MSRARILAVFRHPTPYRDGLLDRFAEMPGVDLEVLYLARTFAQTPWAATALRHRHRFVRGFFTRQVSGHDIALHPGALVRLLRRRPSVAVLSGWSDPTMLLLALACRLLRVPYVLVVESFARTGRFTPAPSTWSERVRRAMVRHAAAWLPAGSRARDHVVSLGADAARCAFFPTAPDADRLATLTDEIRSREPRLREELGLPADRVIAFVGRLVSDKAPDVLLDAIALLPREPPCAVLVAGDGPLRPQMEAHPAADRARFAGFVQPPEVARLLAASDVLVLPSRYETWGAVAQEALAAGIPVILSERVGSAPDLLAGDDAPGEIVPVDDAAALAAAIERVLARPDRRAGLPARARERARAWGHDLNLASLASALEWAGVRPSDAQRPAGVS